MLPRIASASGDDGFQADLFGSQHIEVRVRLGVSRINFLQSLLRAEYFAQSFLHRFAYRLRWIELRFLRKIADVEIGHGGDFPLDLLVQSSHDFQHGGFSRPVESQQAYLRARKEADGNIFENRAPRGNDFAYAIHGNDILGHGRV